jgi:hypothetical protein
MSDPETKGSKLEDRRNVSFSSRRCRIAIYFGEIIIKLNVNLITSNQLSDIGKLERCRVQRADHWAAN